MSSSAHAEHLYQAAIQLSGSEPEPPFEDERRLMAGWGRKWGVDNDVGKIRSVLMHRPGPELSMVDPARKLDTVQQADVEIIALQYDKMQLNGGGIHCSTTPLERDSV